MIWWWRKLDLCKLGTTSEFCCMCAKAATATESMEIGPAQGGSQIIEVDTGFKYCYVFAKAAAAIRFKQAAPAWGGHSQQSRYCVLL